MTVGISLAVFLLYFALLGVVLSYKPAASKNPEINTQETVSDTKPSEDSDINIARASIDREGLVLDRYKARHDRVRGDFGIDTRNVGIIRSLRIFAPASIISRFS